MWEKQVTAKQDYLVARNAMEEADIAFGLSKQRLEAIGYTPAKGRASRFLDLLSPIDGVVVGRDLTLGGFVDTAHASFTVADLSILSVDVAIPSANLNSISVGHQVVIASGDRRTLGKLIFVSPVVEPGTGTAKAVVTLPNDNGVWRSGDVVDVSITTGREEEGLLAPKDAIQSMDGKSVVFVKLEDGFSPVEVRTGRATDTGVEILSGLSAGQEIATGNTFILKAEAEKSEAGHEH